MKNLYCLLFIIMSFSFISCNKTDNIPEIGILQFSDDIVLDKARQAALESLKEAGLIEGKDYKVNYMSAQGEVSNIQMILKSFKSAKVSVILTNGTPCMVGAASQIKDIPVVFTVAFAPQQLGINPSDNLYGYYDPFELKSFIKLIQEIIPNAKRIGLPFNPGEANAAFASKQLIDEAKKVGIEILTQPIVSSNDMVQAAQSLISKNVELFVLSADNAAYQGIPALATIAKRFKKPIFVTDPSNVATGAAIGFGVNYEEWGRASGELLAKILKNEKISVGKINPITKYELIINNKAIQEQGLIVPDEVIKKANKIINN